MAIMLFTGPRIAGIRRNKTTCRVIGTNPMGIITNDATARSVVDKAI
jgi:hypothetical protein